MGGGQYIKRIFRNISALDAACSLFGPSYSWAIAVLVLLMAMLGGCASDARLERSTFAPKSSAIIVFIHGLASNNSIWPQDAVAAMADGVNADSYLFSYDTWMIDIGQVSYTTDEAASRLARELSRPEFAGREINLVGHSQGGIVALRTLLKLPKGSVRRIVMLGTPLFGSKGVPPDWLVPGQSEQLKDLNENSRSLLELNLKLQSYLADGRAPATLSVLSSTDEYVDLHSAFINLRSSRNAVVDMAHNDLPGLLVSGIAGLRERWAAVSPPPNGMKNTLLIKAPMLQELHYFIRMDEDYDPPEADLRVGGYSFYHAIGRDITAEHKSGRPKMTLESLKRSMSEFMLQSEGALSGKFVSEERGPDGKVKRRPVNIPKVNYAGIGSLPSRCAGEGRPLTRIWVRLSGAPRSSMGEAVPNEMLECLEDSDIVRHLHFLGYSTELQRQTLRRVPDGRIIVKKQIPIGQMITRHLLEHSPDRKICDLSSGYIDYDFFDGRFRIAGGVLTEEENKQMEALLRREGAPPPPGFFSRCKPDERIALSGYWVGDYLVVHNLKPGTYRFSLSEILTPFNGGRSGDGLEMDAESVFKRYKQLSYDIKVGPGTTVWQLPDNR